MIDLSNLIQLGDWRVCLVAYADTQASLKNFMEQFRAFSILTPNQDEKKSYLLIVSPHVLAKQQCPSCLDKKEQAEWEIFYPAFLSNYRQFLQARKSNSQKKSSAFVFAWPSLTTNHQNGIQDSQCTRFFVLAIENPQEEAAYLRIFGYTLFLANNWHIKQNGLCIHSAAIANKRQGFLFLGDSGAGKSTTASVSVAAGHNALGDDLNFILANGKEDYLLAAAPSPVISPVGYSMLRPLLRGIFILVKDTKDYLLPLSQKQTALALFDSFQKQTPYTRRLSDKLFAHAFHTIANIARHIPAYELHFRKTPDFWKLIDEKFSG